MAGVRIPFITEFDGKGIDKLTKRMSSVGKSLTKSVTLPLVGLAAAGIKTASEFEASFAKIQGLVGVSAEELGALEEAAKRLGPAYGQSANEAAEALFFITSAGLRGAEAQDVLEKSLKASAVGLGGVQTIADLTTSAMNAYGSDVVDAAKATDVLANAIRLGKLEPEELAGVIGDVLPLASFLGVEFNEVGAAMAAMSKTGTDAATASTQLRGIFSSLTKTTPKAEKQLAAFGLSGAGLREQLREKGLLSVLETLTDTFGDNETAIANVFGNVRALTGVLDLMGANVEDTRSIFGDMAESAGVLDEAFEVTADTAQFQLAQAMADFKAIILEIGQVLIPIFKDTIIPILKDVGEQVKVFVDRFQALDEEGQKQILLFIGIAAAAGPMLIVVAKLITVVTTLGKAVMFLGKAFLFLIKTVIPMLVKSIVFLFTSPLGLLILAIAAVIAIGFLLVKNWDLIKEKAAALFESVRLFFVGIKDAVTENLTIAGEDFKKIMDGFVHVMKVVANGIISYWNFILAGVERVINSIANAINRIPSFTVPSFVPGIGGRSFSPPRMPQVNLPRIPMLADGGIVNSPTIALIGEAGPEAVVPLGRGGMGNVFNITVNAGIGTSGNQVGQDIVEAIRRFERASGPVFASA